MQEKAVESQPALPSTQTGLAAGEPLFAIHEGGGQSLRTVDKDATIELLAKRGAILFRGFSASLEEFVDFSSSFCSQFLEHGSRELRPRRNGDGTVAQVLIGNGPVALHAEMFYSPVRPDALWFYCTKPAGRGGETLIADSRDLLARLSASSRKLLESRKLRYRHVMAPDVWQYNTKQAEVGQAAMLLNFVPNVVATVLEGDHLQMDFETEAIRPTGRSGEPGFINSIANVMEYVGRTTTEVTFADGEPIPEAVLADILQANAGAQQAIQWLPHDVMLIDNSRMLHGRAAFEGEERTIDVRFGVLAPQYKLRDQIH